MCLLTHYGGYRTTGLLHHRLLPKPPIYLRVTTLPNPTLSAAVSSIGQAIDTDRDFEAGYEGRTTGRAHRTSVHRNCQYHSELSVWFYCTYRDLDGVATV